MFDEGLELAHQTVMRTLDVMWKRFIDKPSNYVANARPVTQASFMGRDGRPGPNGALLDAPPPSTVLTTTPGLGTRSQLGTNREFFVNMRTMISQWSRPFWPRTFRSQDLDMETFVQILIRHDVFPKSPFLEILNLSPGDLWPNAETFYKQIKEKEAQQEKAKKMAQLAQQQAAAAAAALALQQERAQQLSVESDAPSSPTANALLQQQLAGSPPTTAGSAKEAGRRGAPKTPKGARTPKAKK